MYHGLLLAISAIWLLHENNFILFFIKIRSEIMRRSEEFPLLFSPYLHESVKLQGTLAHNLREYRE